MLQDSKTIRRSNPEEESHYKKRDHPKPSNAIISDALLPRRETYLAPIRTNVNTAEEKNARPNSFNQTTGLLVSRGIVCRALLPHF